MATIQIDTISKNALSQWHALPEEKTRRKGRRIIKSGVSGAKRLASMNRYGKYWSVRVDDTYRIVLENSKIAWVGHHDLYDDLPKAFKPDPTSFPIDTILVVDKTEVPTRVSDDQVDVQRSTDSATLLFDAIQYLLADIEQRATDLAEDRADSAVTIAAGIEAEVQAIRREFGARIKQFDEVARKTSDACHQQHQSSSSKFTEIHAQLASLRDSVGSELLYGGAKR